MYRDTQTTDPLRNFKYHVDIHHVIGGGYGTLATLGFMSMSGLAAQTDPISYREGGDNTTPRKMPGQTDFPPVVLTRGLFPDTGLTWQWFREIFFVNYGTVPFGTPNNNFRGDIIVKLLQHPLTGPVAIGVPAPAKVAWKLFNAWPASLAYSDLDAGGNGVVVNQMTLMYEGFDTKFAPGVGNYLPADPWAA